MMRAVAFAFTLVALLGSSAFAQEEGDKKAARKLLAEGDRHFKKGDFENALIKYQKAYEAYPNSAIFYAMAQAEEKLGRDIEALTHYEQLISEGPDLPEELRTDAQARIGDIEKRIVVIEFDVRPLGATVTVDNVEIGQAPLDRPVRLMPGMHSWAISKDGFLPVEKEMDIPAGTVVDEVIQLEPEPVVAPAVEEKPKKKPPAPERPARAERTVLIAGITTTAALGAATIVFGFLALSKHGIYTDENATLADREAAQDSGRTLATTTDILLLGTVAAGAFTTWWYFGKYKPAMRAADVREGRADRGTIITPYASEDGGGVYVFGRF
jgi:tetratricopeptide (TPR) repeat protein